MARAEVAEAGTVSPPAAMPCHALPCGALHCTDHTTPTGPAVPTPFRSVLGSVIRRISPSHSCLIITTIRPHPRARNPFRTYSISFPHHPRHASPTSPHPTNLSRISSAVPTNLKQTPACPLPVRAPYRTVPVTSRPVSRPEPSRPVPDLKAPRHATRHHTSPRETMDRNSQSDHLQEGSRNKSNVRSTRLPATIGLDLGTSSSFRSSVSRHPGTRLFPLLHADQLERSSSSTASFFCLAG
ncbi:uncharacterized protein K452DRAFT_114682 [Aplosporella prunicola CBS 121167]|uniref:Uncharacterized protein n=1 Tax=Aplosporella prunicola CBS 121167 TaxID=1176127 RepID=A0A6A6B0N9_9PEZI|nr:uncharacterized protein K452DRAFT_114682 [Aplosporella prunicola CBS 121167]KAF2136993.1 hypothetical protein K452DRAFT_114682 [Aplosporella prunicola CBS 121167]